MDLVGIEPTTSPATPGRAQFLPVTNRLVLVDLVGIEPTTFPATPGRAQFALLTNRLVLGGPGRDRTDDLFHAMEARSQLRHRPTFRLELHVYSHPHPALSQLKRDD